MGKKARKHEALKNCRVMRGVFKAEILHFAKMHKIDWNTPGLLFYRGLWAGPEHLGVDEKFMLHMLKDNLRLIERTMFYISEI